MTFRTAAVAAATASIAFFSGTAAFAAQAQTQPADGQWRMSTTTLSTLLQDGYRIVAVVNGAQGNGTPGDTIFVQRDQSAFKCLDPQQPDARTTTAAAPACFELVPPSGAAGAPDAK